METEKMMIILTELLEDQKEIMKQQQQTFGLVESLNNSINDINNRTTDTGLDKVEIDYKPLQEYLEKSIGEIKHVVDIGRQKQVQNNLRIFLESDAKRWVVYLIVSLTFLTYLYWIIIRK